ncbi:TlpA family protein disulfide reductase [Pseudarthrobacter sp. J1738]|uniref:TlpA family protein disulfide reductase n=1 Tax=unclassified Pseudarthrobacter TaxID=2647000 RepID=UPI003D2A9218
MDQNIAQSARSLSRRKLFSMAGVAATGMVGAVALSACSSDDSLAQQARAGDNKNYIAGDGSVSEYNKNDRKAAVDFTGVLFDGTKVPSKDLLGKVVVMNFWYAACAPCRVEAPSLRTLHQEFKPKGVEFYGVNLSDERATAEAFEKTFKLDYPTFSVKMDSGMLLALAKEVPPKAVPTTLVFDKQGKVAARILGRLEEGTLRSLISSAVAE